MDSQRLGFFHGRAAEACVIPVGEEQESQQSERPDLKRLGSSFAWGVPFEG